jgi:hypothetical protein
VRRARVLFREGESCGWKVPIFIWFLLTTSPGLLLLARERNNNNQDDEKPKADILSMGDRAD